MRVSVSGLTDAQRATLEEQARAEGVSISDLARLRLGLVTPEDAQATTQLVR